MLRDFLPVVESFGSIEGLTLIMFLLFFAGLLIWVWKLDKTIIHKMENLPLEENNIEIKNPVKL